VLNRVRNKTKRKKNKQEIKTGRGPLGFAWEERDGREGKVLRECFCHRLFQNCLKMAITLQPGWSLRARHSYWGCSPSVL